MPVRLIAAVIVVVAAGCSALDSGTDFDRHRLSSLLPADEAALFWFDVQLTPTYPDDPAGEAVRQAWISDWLDLRGYCPFGHEVLGRRPFGPDDDNPRRADLRYDVRCRPAP